MSTARPSSLDMDRAHEALNAAERAVAIAHKAGDVDAWISAEQAASNAYATYRALYVRRYPARPAPPSRLR